MNDSLITLASYMNPMDAYIARSKLESEGIYSVVFDDNVIHVNWLYSNAVGGVKLKVKESEAQRALALLEEGETAAEPADLPKAPPPAEPPPVIQCPRCFSASVSQEIFPRRFVFLSWLLLGFPIPLIRRRWLCNTCGHRWKRH